MRLRDRLAKLLDRDDCPVYTPEEYADAAAFLLNQTDGFQLGASEAFFPALDDDAHAELVARASDETERV